MSNTKNLKLIIVSQEKKLEEVETPQVTLPTASGEITVLPEHIALISRLTPGILEYSVDGKPQQIVISNGFLDVSPNSKVTVMVDTAVHARDASEEKARAAIEAAHKTMAESTDRRELLMAEASLKQAMLELRVAQKTKKVSI